MRRIAIVPARSGSKGLHDKNIADLCGKPMMAYSIQAAIKGDLFERVICSTDSELYADIARCYGAEVMMRDASLSGDSTPTFHVIEDLLRRLDNPCDLFVLLQPTSPLRNEQHIREAVAMFENKMDRFDFLVSVKEAEHASDLVKPIEEDGSLKHFDTDFSSYSRQNKAEYSPNGAIFIAKPDPYLKRKHFFGDKALAYFMSQSDSIDVDTEDDLKIAALFIKQGGECYE